LECGVAGGISQRATEMMIAGGQGAYITERGCYLAFGDDGKTDGGQSR